MAIVSEVIQPAKAQTRAETVAFARVVENEIENDAYAMAVKFGNGLRQFRHATGADADRAP